VAGTEARVREAIKLGFNGAILPRGDKISVAATFKLHPAARLGDAMEAAFAGG
jgi:DNA repair protein RadA/Sms